MKKFAILLTTWLLLGGVAFAQVNINTAKKDELDALKGIGPSKAQAIIDYRRKNGAFKSVDELQKVPGIGPATLADLRGDVTVSGHARLPAATPAKAADEARAVRTQPPLAAPAIPRPASPAKPAVPPAISAPNKTAESTPLAAPATPSFGTLARPAIPAPTASPAAMAAPAKPPAPARPAMPATPPGE